MKFTIDVADEDVAKFVAFIQAGVAPAAQAPAKAPKAEKAPKPQPAAETPPAPAAAAKDAPSRDDVHAALSKYSQEHGKDAALTILHKYSKTLSALPEDKFAEVIEKLSAPVLDTSDAFD